MVFRHSQRDWTLDYAHPAVFWSGESQNGTVFMLVRIQSLLTVDSEDILVETLSWC